jgi:predicted nucleic acid-binding protein
MDPVLIDANLGLALVLPLPYSGKVQSHIGAWLDQGRRLLVPVLWEYEVASALRRAESLGVITGEQVANCARELWALDLERVAPSPELHASALQWSRRLAQSKAYDGQYLAAAEWAGAEFWTADARLAEQARQIGALWVHAL